MIDALVALLASLGSADAPVDAARHAFVELETERTAYFANEPFVVQLRVGVEQAFLRDHVVQLFAQHLDVPVQVQAPWLGACPDVAAAGLDAAARQTFALDDAIVAGKRLDDRIVDGRAFTVLELERHMVARDPGPLALPAPRLVLAYATTFDDDLVRGRVALDRLEATIAGEPLSLTIAPLPDAGRPREFTGAIGRCTIRAAASAREVDVGHSFTLTVTIEGAGNVGEFAPPAWNALDGFHVLGTLERSEGSSRTFVLDLAATRADVNAVPGIAFAYFDPAAGGSYATVHSDAIPLAVRAGAAAVPTSSEPGARDAPRTWTIALVAAVAAALLFLAWRRARARVAPSAEDADARRRADGALAAFRARVAADPRALEAALVAYFVARLRCAESAVIAADLGERLVRRGVAAADAREATRVLEALVASRYGGSPSTIAAADVVALIARIDAALAAVSG